MYLDINEARLYVSVLGEEHPQAVLALHGGPGLADQRGEQRGLGGLASDYKLVTYDHRGCGRSSDTPPYTNDQYVEDVEALRQALRLGKIILYGGSYGGFIALLYALRYPQHLSHLILRDTSPNNQFVGLAKANALESLDKAPGVTEAMLDRMFEGRVRDNEDFKDLYEKITPLYWVGPPKNPAQEKDPQVFYHYQTHNAMFQQEFARYDVTEQLHQIKVSTLVTVGKHDWITPPVAAQLIASRIPNAELAVFEHSGHSPQLEQSQEYVETVKAFVNRR